MTAPTPSPRTSSSAPEKSTTWTSRPAMATPLESHLGQAIEATTEEVADEDADRDRVQDEHRSRVWHAGRSPRGRMTRHEAFTTIRAPRILRPMTALYPWFVFAHLVGLVLFAISHGASAFVAFRV